MADTCPHLEPRVHPDEPGVLWAKDRRVETADGAEIAYTFRGPDDAPVVALAPGFCCPDTWWWFLVPALARAGYRVLIHHPRGIAASTLPTRRRPDSFSVPRTAADLADVVDAEGIAELALIGHSMGVQVALEAYRQLGERVWSLALVTGSYASPVRTLYDRGITAGLVYAPLRTATRLLPRRIADGTWSALWTHVPALAVGRMLTAFGPRTPAAIIDSYTGHAATLAVSTVTAIADGMHGHSARDLLADVATPTLVVQGGKDPFSPRSVGERMWRLIPGARYKIVPNGSHGAALEYPELVNGWVLDHLDRSRRG